MQKFGVGFVGCGTIAFAKDGYLPGMAKLGDRLEIVAACDLILARAQKAIDDYGGQRAYSDLAEMLVGAEDIDIVVNLTPIPLHGQINQQILAAGKHLVTEKPIANTLAEAYEILETAQANQLKIVAAPLDAILPHNQKVKELIAEGAIGRVCFARVHSSHAGPADFPFWPVDPSWFYQEGSGALLDMGVYGLTSITGILGPAQRVVAYSGITDPQREILGGPQRGKQVEVEADDNTLLMLDFGRNIFAVVDGTYNLVATKGPGVEIYGRRGTIMINQPWWDATQPLYELYSLENQGEPPRWESPGLDEVQVSLNNYQDIARASMIAHLADCIEHDLQPVVSGEHAVHVLEIMLKALQSARERRSIALETAFPFEGGV